jgi:AcrR family transcriptional regulator
MARTIAKDYDAKRSAILKKSAQYFADQGYDRASVSQVAGACGISKSLIYHYYESKEQLLFDILQSHLNAIHECVTAISNHNKDPKTHLRHLVAELLTAYRGADAEHRLQLQSTTALSLEQQHELAETQRAIVKIFADTIESIAPDYLQGMPQYQRPITMSLFGMLNWFYLWYQPGGGMTRIEYANLATEILLGGLDRLRCNKQQISLKRTKVTLETKIPL